MQDIEIQFADRDLVAFVEPAIRRESRTRSCQTRAARHHIVEQGFLSLPMWALDRHLSASRSSAAPTTWSIWPWVTPDLFDAHAGLLDRRQDPGNVAAGINDEGPCLVVSHQMMVQFCSNGVTGTMIALLSPWPRFPLVIDSCRLEFASRCGPLRHESEKPRGEC